jgi:hypothetical protein
MINPILNGVRNLLQGKHRSARATDILAVFCADEHLKAFLARLFFFVDGQIHADSPSRNASA